MGDSVALVTPSAALRTEYLSFYQDWVASGEDMVPWVISKRPSDFDTMLRFLAESDTVVPDGKVPHSTYWLVTGTGRVVGAANLRHRLNDRLLRLGGHIGYGIRPSDRRRGYATALLALTLEKARSLGLQRVLLCCDQGNVASERTIRKNGGIPDESHVEEDGTTVLRFWLDL